MLRLGIFPAFDNKFAANILGMWEIWVDFTPHVGALVPSEAVHNTAVQIFLINRWERYNT